MKIKINEDESIVREIRTELKANGGYCPCALVKNEDTRCICKEFREKNTIGYCHCRLYQKVDD